MSGTNPGDDKRITFLTPVLRASYVNFLEPRAVGDGPDSQKRYGVSLIIDPGPDCDFIWSKICEAANKFFSEPHMSGIVKLQQGVIHNPLRSGAQRSNDPAYAGKMFMNGGGKTPPLCYDISNNVIGPAAIYSGCFVRCVLNLYGFNVKQKKGIGVGVQYVQFIRDGERLGNTASVEGGQKAFAAAPLPPGALPPAPSGGMPREGTGFNGQPTPGYAAPPPGGYPQPGAPAAYPPQPPAYAQQPPAYAQQPPGYAQQPPAYGGPPNGYGAPPAAPPPANGYPPNGAPNGYPQPAQQGYPAAPPAANGYGAPPQQGYPAAQPPAAPNGYGAPPQQGYPPAAPPGPPPGGYAPPPPAPGYPAPGAQAYPPPR